MISALALASLLQAASMTPEELRNHPMTPMDRKFGYDSNRTGASTPARIPPLEGEWRVPNDPLYPDPPAGNTTARTAEQLTYGLNKSPHATPARPQREPAARDGSAKP